MYLSRKTERDYTFEENQLTIRKGLKIFIPIYAIQHDPSVYPNPEVFDPERFNSDNNEMKNSMYYLPFGTGPRNCIGNLELTLACAKLAPVSIAITIFHYLETSLDLEH